MIMLFTLLVAYACWMLANRSADKSQRRPQMLVGLDASYAISFGAAHFILYPASVIYDDGGIILKYMDNFAAGHFFCYNIADGPVYGISGFIHGIFAGGLAWLHLLSPDNALLASNLSGMILLSFAFLRILRCILSDDSAVFPCWIISLLLSRYLLITAKQGLETPLHLAIVMFGVLFMLRGRECLFWFFETLMVISKLDALPVAAILAIVFVAQRHGKVFPISLRNPLWYRFLAFAVLPGIAWVTYVLAVFGTVLPQSARAKLFYLGHPSDSWFPFVTPLFEGRLAFFTTALLAILVGHVLIRMARGELSLICRECVLGLSGIGHLGLYYFYNPAEQMPWYYTLPDFFLTAQGITSVFLVVTRWSSSMRATTSVVVLCGYAFVIWPNMGMRIREHARHFDVIEHERIAVGRWIGDHSAPTDIVMCGHGHIARNTHRYVIDYSGLNSKVVTDLKMDMGAITALVKPEWVVLHGVMEPGLAARYGYRLVKSFYNISTAAATSAGRQWRKGESWRVYSRDAASVGLCDADVPTKQISSDGTVETNGATFIQGRTIGMEFSGRLVSARRLDCGFACGTRATPTVVRFVDGAGVTLTNVVFTIPVERLDDFEGGYTRECQWSLDPEWRIAHIVVVATGAPMDRLTMMSPVLVGVNAVSNGWMNSER